MSPVKANDYVVEKIVGKRINENGRPSYLIKWKGYVSSENTWEPEAHVKNCQELIREFEHEQAKKSKSRLSARRGAVHTLKEENGNSSVVKNRSSRSRSRHSNLNSAGSESRRNNSLLTDDEDEANENKKSITKRNSRRSNQNGTEDSKFLIFNSSKDDDSFDGSKLEQIVNVRRNRRANQVEYQVQFKKTKKTAWILSNQMIKTNAEQIIDYLEKKFL